MEVRRNGGPGRDLSTPLTRRTEPLPKLLLRPFDLSNLIIGSEKPA